MQIAVLNRTSRILAGHLWVFSNELKDSPKKFIPASLLELRDRKNTFIGIGYVNPHSLIAVRILTRERVEIDEGFFQKKINEALDYRKNFLKDADSFRAVYSEGDYLPGLIVDKYGDCLSIQFLTLGMEALTDVIIKALDDTFKPSTIVLRNDSSARTLEGMALEKKVIKGNLDKLPVINEGGLFFEIDPMAGQKTGFFLDQRENRSAFAALCKGGTGLDLFCYSGAWSINLAASGVSMTGVDSSDFAISQAKKNAELNKLTGKCEFIKSDVFDFLKSAGNGKKYDSIVLDPPAFVKSKTKINEGLRAYRETNAKVMGMMRYGGLLATSSCSYHVDRLTFLDMLRDAARDAGKRVRIIEVRSQAKDHPISLSVPETEYLKCVLLEVR